MTTTRDLPDWVRREAWWVAGIGTATIVTAGVTTNYGARGWLLTAAALYASRPATRLWGRTRPVPGLIPDPVQPRKTVERVSRRMEAAGKCERFKKAWPKVSEEAGWCRTTERTVTGKDGKPTLAKQSIPPQLAYCRPEGTDTIAIGWYPWINVGEKNWDSLAHTLRRAVKGQTVRWWINPADSGLMEVRVGLTPLPEKIILDKPYPPAATDGSARVILGPQAGGGVAAWAPGESPHMLIAGKTRYGKGGTLRMILSQVAPSSIVYVWSPKIAGEFAWLRGFPKAQVVKTTEDAVRMLEEVDEERRRREHELDARGLEKVWDLPAAERPTPIYLIIDELTEAIGDNSNRLTEKAADLVVRLARLAAACGIHLVVATQRPDVAGGALGKRGGLLREQLTARLVVGAIGKTGLGMVLEGSDGDVLAGLPGMKGRALATGLDADGGSDVFVVQVAWLPQGAAAGGGTRAPLVTRESEVDSDVPIPGDTPLKGCAGGVCEPESEGSEAGSGSMGDSGGEPVGTPTDGETCGNQATCVEGPDDPVSVDGVVGDRDPSLPGGDGDAASFVADVDQFEDVSVADAAARFGVTPRTVYNWARNPERPDIREAGWGKVAVRRG